MKQEHKMVYEFIKQNPLCTISDLQIKLGLSPYKLRQITRELELLNKGIKRARLEITTSKDFSYDGKKLGAPLTGFFISDDDMPTNNQRHYMLYDYIKGNPYCSIKSISETLDINQNSLRIALKEMREIFPDLKRRPVEGTRSEDGIKTSNAIYFEYFIEA
jgi:predicted transcriptional regulator